MILLTVGTQEPFDRLVQCVDEWATSRGCGDRVRGQITDRASYHPTSFEWVPKLDPAAFVDACRVSDLIVSHAGIGSIITAMRMEKPIVIVPRRAHLGEQRNDHQRATAERFESRPGVYVASDTHGLPGLLDRYLEGELMGDTGFVNVGAAQNLIDTIRAFIYDSPGSARSSASATPGP